jgi:WD40 repeat protein
LRCAVGESFSGWPPHLEPQAGLHEGADKGVVSSDGRVCAVATEKNWRFFRTDSFAELAATVTRPPAFGEAFSPDGTLFAAGASHRPGVTVWDANAGALVKQLAADDGHVDTSANVVFSPDGSCLVTSISSEYCFWNVRSWSLTKRIPQPTRNDFPAPMAFSPDGKVFAGTHSRNVVRLYDTASAQVLADLEAPNSKQVSSLSFNNDGSLLAACESRDALRVWDLRVIREKLAGLGLDWEMPPYPPHSAAAPLPPAIPVSTNAPEQTSPR